MQVSLIDYTGKGDPNPGHYAAGLLAFTKNTRLNMTTGTLVDWYCKTPNQLNAELEYMANTIPSSWEFVDYTFVIEGVSRAFTHQFVRTRTASYAQQTMRILDVSEGPGWDYLTGPTILHEPIVGGSRPSLKSRYDIGMRYIADLYKDLIGEGAKVEDARGILPTNILTNITVKMNMRTFVEMARKRASSRTQGEYRDVLDAMKEVVKKAHPWIDLFLSRTVDKAVNDLEAMVIGSDLGQALKTQMIKQLDIIREQA